MRYKMQKYQDKKSHRFYGIIDRCSTYTDRSTGRKKESILFTDVKDENQRHCAGHVWITKTSKIKKQKLETGKVYTFMAKVGTYKRGRTSSDYQLKDISALEKIA